MVAGININLNNKKDKKLHIDLGLDKFNIIGNLQNQIKSNKRYIRHITTLEYKRICYWKIPKKFIYIPHDLMITDPYEVVMQYSVKRKLIIEIKVNLISIILLDSNIKAYKDLINIQLKDDNNNQTSLNMHDFLTLLKMNEMLKHTEYDPDMQENRYEQFSKNLSFQLQESDNYIKISIF